MKKPKTEFDKGFIKGVQAARKVYGYELAQEALKKIE
mgnify:CR=1 FL=1